MVGWGVGRMVVVFRMLFLCLGFGYAQAFAELFFFLSVLSIRHIYCDRPLLINFYTAVYSSIQQYTVVYSIIQQSLYRYRIGYSNPALRFFVSTHYARNFHNTVDYALKLIPRLS
jgi:hypothetical protein